MTQPTGAATAKSAARMRVTFAVAFALCLSAFIASSLILRGQSKAIGDAAISIATNGGPSIGLLATLRTTLRHREVALDDYVDGLSATSKPSPTGLPLSEGPDRANMKTEAQTYLALPSYPGEREMQPQFVAALTQLNDTVDRVATQVQVGRPDAAEHVMNTQAKPAFDRLDQRLQVLTELNARASRLDADRISAVHRRVTHLASLLNLACALLTLCAGYFAFRVVRESARLMTSQISELELYASRMAHDVRGPLASVKLAIELSARDVASAKSRAMLERAARIVQRVGELMDGLLLIAGMSTAPDRQTWASLRAVFADLREELAPAVREHEVELEMPEPPECAVACSTGVLANIVSNLAGNAVKYMGSAAVRRVSVRADELAHAVRITVQDSGPGIPKSFQSQLFKPFTRVAPAGVFGLGLGLATVQRLTTALGGQVGFESHEGNGALFWVELPKHIG